MLILSLTQVLSMYKLCFLGCKVMIEQMVKFFRTHQSLKNVSNYTKFIEEKMAKYCTVEPYNKHAFWLSEYIKARKISSI